MSFWRLIYRSIYSPPFYRELLGSPFDATQGKPFKFSLKYFATLALGLAVALTVLFSARIISPVGEFLKKIGPAVVSNFPEGLVVTLKDGSVSVNAEEPYVVSLPQALRDAQERARNEDANEGAPTANLLVIDTREPVSLERFAELNTLLWVAKSNVVFREKGGIRIDSLERFPDFVIDEGMARKLADGIDSLRRFVAPVIVFGSFFVILFLMAFTFVYLLFGAVVVWVAARLRRVPVGYGKAYQLALHAVTLTLFYDALFFIVPVPARVPFFGTILLFVAALANLRPDSSAPSSPAQDIPPSVGA